MSGRRWFMAGFCSAGAFIAFSHPTHSIRVGLLLTALAIFNVFAARSFAGRPRLLGLLRASRFGAAWHVVCGRKVVYRLGSLDITQDLDGLHVYDTRFVVRHNDLTIRNSIFYGHQTPKMAFPTEEAV